jgi:hypothetical protein
MKHISNELPESCVSQFGLKSAELVAQRPRSRIFRGHTEAGDLALKQCLSAENGEIDSQQARMEFESLQRLDAAIEQAGIDRLAPKPVGLAQRDAVLAITWEAGTPLTKLILSFPVSQARARDYGAMAGKLLRQLHGLQLQAAQPGGFQSIVSFLEDEVDCLATSHPLFDNCLRLLSILAPRVEAMPIPVSWTFGDFKSDNILIRPQGALLLDVHLLENKPVVFNIAQFIVHLLMLRWDPRGVLYRQSLISACDDFLRGYSVETEHWRLPIEWLIVEMILHRCIALAQSRDIHSRISLSIAQRALVRSRDALARWC